MVSAMQLTTIESRVLGALLEKAATTPEYYPLSSQALVTACNQSQNREPVTDYEESDVLDAVYSLRDRGLARSVKRPGDRVMKHQHDLERTLGLDDRSRAVLAILLLRGPQTPGELRTRTDRYVDFSALDEVEEVLEALASRETPLAVQLDRQPGQKESRWLELLSDHPQGNGLVPSLPRERVGSGREPLEARVAQLEVTVADLLESLATLRMSLGG